LTLRNRAALLVSALFVSVLAAAAGVAVARGSGAGGSGKDSPLLVAPSRTTEAPPITRGDRAPTSTTVPLPTPEPPPADPYADVPVIQIGRIEIPKIGVDHPIYEGITLTVIDSGPGHWPGTALPGERGNTVFPGHRVTHTRPFYDIDLLAAGDEVIFHMPAADYTYRVTGTLIVLPGDLWVVDQTEEPTMTILGCHPKHSARQRFVVRGVLVRTAPTMASAGIAVQAGDALAGSA